MSLDQHNPFNEVVHQDDDHPLDQYVMTQIPSAMTENITAATKALIRALGGDCRPWVDLECLLNEYRLKCEEILYNRGYENGYIACGVAAAEKLRTQEPNIEFHCLTEKLQKSVGVSHLSTYQRVLALLDVATAVVRQWELNVFK